MQTFVPALVALTAATVALDPVPGLAATTVAEALTELAGRPSGGGSDVGVDAANVAFDPMAAGMQATDVQGAVEYLKNRVDAAVSFNRQPAVITADVPFAPDVFTSNGGQVALIGRKNFAPGSATLTIADVSVYSTLTEVVAAVNDGEWLDDAGEATGRPLTASASSEGRLVLTGAHGGWDLVLQAPYPSAPAWIGFNSTFLVRPAPIFAAETASVYDTAARRPLSETLQELSARPIGGGSPAQDASSIAIEQVPMLDGATVQAAIETLSANRTTVPAPYVYLADSRYTPPASDVTLDLVYGGQPRQVTVPAGSALADAISAINAQIGEPVAQDPVGGYIAFLGLTELDFSVSSRASLDALGILDTPHLVAGERVADTRADAVAISGIDGLAGASTVEDAVRQLAARPIGGGSVGNSSVRTLDGRAPNAEGDVSSLGRLHDTAAPPHVRFNFVPDDTDGQTLTINGDPALTVTWSVGYTLDTLAADLNGVFAGSPINGQVAFVAEVRDFGGTPTLFIEGSPTFYGTDFTVSGTLADTIGIAGVSYRRIDDRDWIGDGEEVRHSPGVSISDRVEDVANLLAALTARLDTLRQEHDAYVAAHP